MEEYPECFLKLLNSVTAKRPRTVIQHILAHGYITSRELQDIYGYNHPPRAVRDVRELGIPIITYRVTDKDGKSIAAYKFGVPDDSVPVASKASGRTVLSKALKQALIDKYGAKCFLYCEYMDENILQVDHRVPYEINGEDNMDDIDCYMLVCPSANRAKSWTCEHCDNWKVRDKNLCLGCFWAFPERYTHIAGKNERMVTIVFSEHEVQDYDKLMALSGEQSAQQIVKDILKEYLG